MTTNELLNSPAPSSPPKKTDHRWKPGQSGNYAGRPKGSKNAITLAKLALESELRAQMKNKMGSVVEKIMEQALAGDVTSQKMLFDAWVSKSRSSNDDDAPKERVHISIGRMDSSPPTINGQVIREHEVHE